MDEIEAYEILAPSIKKYKDIVSVELKKLKTVLCKDELFVVIAYDKGMFDIYLTRIQKKKEIYYQFIFVCPPKFDEDGIFPYQNTILSKQIDQFRYKETSAFFYDFNHDGNEKLLGFRTSGHGIYFMMITFDVINNGYKRILNISIPLPSEIPAFEFINYKGRQGIKYYGYDYINDTYVGWIFYYYDRIQQEYVWDETASSEELEQIHGSPDFFAEAGIDYTKLERPLIPADLEGFSKPALRIWRNAVYARHGRTFKSEDLQALFNEYAWYKADKNYTDAKLTDTDKANIKLISEFEKK